jgi:hypothetical protein
LTYSHNPRIRLRQQLSNPLGVRHPVLCLVQLQSTSPSIIGDVVAAEGGVRVTEPVPRVGLAVGGAELLVQGKGFLVAVDGVGVLAVEPREVAQGVQHRRLALPVAAFAGQRERLLAVRERLLVVAEQGG